MRCAAGAIAASNRRRSAARRGRISNRRTRVFEAAPRTFARFDRCADPFPQPEFLLIDALQIAADAAVQHAQRAVDSLLAQTAIQHRQPVAQTPACLGSGDGDAFDQIFEQRDGQFRRRRRRGRAQVGDEIRDGDVGFMAHRRDHRHGACRNRARHGFFVERPQVFERAAAAAGDHQIGPTASG